MFEFEDGPLKFLNYIASILRNPAGHHHRPITHALYIPLLPALLDRVDHSTLSLVLDRLCFPTDL
jgi:hypothetical protein